MILYVKHLKEHHHICFGCNYHLKMTSLERIEHLIDPGALSVGPGVVWGDLIFTHARQPSRLPLTRPPSLTAPSRRHVAPHG